MVLEAIYVVRHGFRLNWVVDPQTGTYSSSAPTPTGIPSDPCLAAYGEQQSQHFAQFARQLQPPIDVVYSSPFYRCLQTLAPTITALKEDGVNVRVRVENGVGEFYGKARFDHPSPATLDILHHHFDFLDPDHRPSIIPSKDGETSVGIHNRHAYALHRIIEQLDNESESSKNGKPQALLICTHAASMICIGRVLTGDMPDDINVEDFRCGTCALSKFVRRKPVKQSSSSIPQWNQQTPDDIPELDWRDGKGVGSGWDCVLNGDCSFLPGGEERTWHFHGDESFIDFGGDPVGSQQSSASDRPMSGNQGGSKL